MACCDIGSTMSHSDDLVRPFTMTTARRPVAPVGSNRLASGARPDWLATTVWPHRVRTLDVADATVAYTDVGTGPTLLFVHVGMWSILWRDTIERLGDRYRCVTLDAPGSGLSQPGSGSVSLTAAADAVDALVRSLDLGDLTLVVHDLGAIAALDAAGRWPDRVVGLVVINGFGWKPDGIAFRAMLASMGNPAAREIDAFTGWMTYASATRFGVARNWDRPTRRAYRRRFRRPQRRVFHRYIAAARRHDYGPTDSAVAGLADRPLLTIFGQRNDPLRFHPRWRARFPRATQVTVPKGYHFPMCDAPDLVARATRDWHDERLRPGATTPDEADV